MRLKTAPATSLGLLTIGLLSLLAGNGRGQIPHPRWPYILPPGTPSPIVNTLRGAMAKSFKDPEFHKEFKKLMANDPTPLTGEEMESAIKELPRDPEIVGLYKKLAEQGPIPAR